MEALDSSSIYTLQDKALVLIFSEETSFYLTGGTCLNRFYHNRRYSNDLDPEILEYRLSSFPLELLDFLKVIDPITVNEMKNIYNDMVEYILQNFPR